MEFKPRAPREDVNVSPEHPLKEAGTLLLGITAAIVLLVVFLAWSVDLAVAFIPPEAETRLFSSVGAEIASLTASTGHEDEGARAQAIVDRLARHWPEAPYDFRVGIFDIDDPNAAAIPGGYILVTPALFEMVESEEELAFVLGHELGHFYNRDHLRRLGRSVLYGVVLAVVAGFSGAVPDFATVAGELTSSGFDRQQESDADRFGLQLVYAEYADISSSWRFFERLAARETAVGRMAAYFATHPADSERIRSLTEFARRQGWAMPASIEELAADDR